jgi:hypothetical protein
MQISGRDSESLDEEMENAGVMYQQFETLLRFSEQQLRLLIPSFNLGDRRILRAGAETEGGKKLLADFTERRVNRLQIASHAMSAELLCTFFVDNGGSNPLLFFDDDDFQRATANALKLREQGIRRLAVLMDVALMETGEEILTNCGLRAGEIAEIIVCARSDYGESVLAAWKRRISARINGEDDSDIESTKALKSESESESESESDLERASVEPQSAEASARSKRAAEDVERTDGAKRHHAQGGTVGDRFEFNQSEYLIITLIITLRTE